MRVLLFCAICVAVWIYFSGESVVELSSGVQVTTPPHQSDISDVKPFSFKGYTVTPLAKIDFLAKILSKKNYSNGKESELSPVDLALGWQNMSDQAIVNQFKISQSNRWYRWRVSGDYPIPRKEIQTQSANMHMIPANSLIDRTLKKAKKGQVISISGYLISANKKNWHWKSSLTRDDTGGGACELIYVESLDILNR